MKLIYFDYNDACCEGTYKSQKQLLAENAVIGTAYLAPDDFDEDKAWGDDWNDAPKCCNAGPPYEDKVPGLVVKEIKLGEPLTNNHNESK